jgi:hypothetical protein
MKLESIYLHSFDISFDVHFFLCENMACEMVHFILEQNDSDEPISYKIDINVLSWEYKESEEYDAPSELVDDFFPCRGGFRQEILYDSPANSNTLSTSSSDSR